ncbi:HNH endonuclease [Bradyrhizobium genosp. L]|uniref:HNH endonuclease signature motif containing protein n=1 Tax=Bradyrhizobium genosp. L TaxID=83637 RepID=UPI003D9B051A
MNGEWPNGEVDHIDGNRDNNKLSNLRVVTRQQNCWNRGLGKGRVLRNITFKSGKPHVSFSRGYQRFYCKAFHTLCSAIHERNRIARETYGEFSRSYAKE